MDPRTLGVTGYCMGAHLALRAAAQLPDLVAAVGMFHAGGIVTGAADSPHLAVTRVRAELVAHGYSMADTSMYDEVAAERHFTELEDLFARALG